jgi:[acyl-carrier-protein] S-malonyltransferase
LVASGSIDFEDALLLVHKRGLFMEKCDAGSMFAILNLDLETIDSICSEVSSRLNQSISSANINSLNQVVIAGTHEAAQAAADQCKEKGAKRAIQLKVSVASHCELMNQASILLSDELKNISFKNPNIPILHNINASESDGDISNLLTDQLTQPVQWSKTMEEIKSYNGIVVECGPGKVLSGLAKNNGLTDIYSMSSSQFEEDFNNIYE